MSTRDRDDTLTLVNKLRVHLAVYRNAHVGKNPKYVEVHPSVFQLILNVSDRPPVAGIDGPTFDGVPIRIGSDVGSLFIFVDP